MRARGGWAVSIAWVLAVILSSTGADGAGSSGGIGSDVRVNERWAEQAFAETPPPPTNRLTVVHEDGSGDTKVGRCAAGGPLRLGDKTYAHGIGVNSHSVLVVSLVKPAARFQAVIGLDRNVDRTKGSVRFRVRVGGKDVFATDVIRPGHRPQTIDVPLKGAKRFELMVDDGGDGRGWDQGDWVDARVVLEDGSALWLDELARGSGVEAELPFSFVYGGQPSADVIGSWRRAVYDEVIDATRRRRTLTLTDPKTGLEVRAVCTIYTDTPGVDWTLHFANTGSQDTPILEQVRAVDVGIDPGPGAQPVLHRLHGSSCAAQDWEPFDQVLPVGKRIAFAPRLGRPSLGACPFFALSWQGGGVVTAIGWSGQWSASVERRLGIVGIAAGMQHLRLKLRPGERIRSPRILQVRWTGDEPLRGYNLFRRTMLRHVLPKVKGQPVTPPIAHLSTSFYELDRGTEVDVLAHLEAAKGLGFEVFWLDAYYGRDDFPRVGNYVFPIERAVNRKRFPNGPETISDAAHAAGMKFLLWVEPERISEGTLVDKEHPEWVIRAGKDPVGQLGLYNLGLPAAREHLTRFLKTIIEQWGIDCLRVDYATSALACWEKVNKENPDRAGLAEIRCVEGLYRLWDDLLETYPHLFIDNCASGGMRIDLETCSRSIPLWRTDATIEPLMRRDFNEAAIRNQVITAGLSRYLPFHTSGMMGSTPYWFRSGFNAGIAFCEDVRGADYPRQQLERAIAEGKRIRKYYFGDFYPLSVVNTSPREWCVMQYHRPDDHDGMIAAFRRHESPYASFICDLHAIDPAARYEVTRAPSYDRTRPVVVQGTALQHFKAEIDERPGSLIVEYKKVN